MSTRTRGWRKTIQLKDLLTTDDSPETVRRVAREMVTRLKKQREYDPFGVDDFLITVEEMNDIAKSTGDDYDEGLTLCEHFNSCMEQLYDWADENRVWIA